MILVNGIAAENVPARDRGLHYGDGVFRTLRMCAGRALHWPLHLEKLQADCRALALANPDSAALMTDLGAIARDTPDCVVKIIVTRGSGQRGYAPPENPVPTRIVMSAPLPAALPANTGVELHLCALRLSHQPALAGIKHLNRLENVMARAEWHEQSIREGLLCDAEGNAICGTMSNLFIVEKGKLTTPDVTHCGVAGVTRLRMLQAARARGIRCTIENIPLQRVLDADELFLVNSVIGLWPVARLVNRTWVPGKLSTVLARWIEEDDASVY